MAVTKLKLMSISGGMKEFGNVLYMCENDPYIHVEDASAMIRYGLTEFSVINSADNNPYKELFTSIGSLAALVNINVSAKLRSAGGINKSNKTEKVDIENIKQTLDLNTDETQALIKSRSERLKNKHEEIRMANELIRENRNILNQLEHIGNISANLDSFFRFEFFKFRFGHMPRDAYDSMTMYGMADMDDVFFIPSCIEKNEIWGIYFTTRKKSQKIDSMFAASHFERVRILDKARGTPENAKIDLEKETVLIEKKIDELNDELEEIILEIDALASQYYERIYTLFNIYELRKKTLRSNSSFYMIAWIPENHVEKVSHWLAQLSTVIAPVSSPSDVPLIEPPPLLKNLAPFKPFEQFVKMYGLPSYNEIDPTSFLAVTYVLFFGVMFGDVGQGLLISIAGFLLWRIKKINLGKIAGMLGLSSAFFGVIFGSVFGLEDVIHGYNPMNHINTVLIAAIGLGIFTVSGAIIINIINGIKQKNIEKILFSQNGLAGLIFYWAIIIAALIMLKFVPIKISVAIFITTIIFCGVLIYLREPLANLISRKQKIIPHNPVEFFTSNLFEMFEIILSFLTNTISFIRVGAFALNHVGMMSVVRLLAENSSGGGANPVVLIVGNIIVISLEGLIVGIQCLRLQYYEIFGRFYDGGGRSF